MQQKVYDENILDSSKFVAMYGIALALPEFVVKMNIDVIADCILD